MFEVGKKVVCIDDKPDDSGDLMFGLKQNEIYPVLETRVCSCGESEIYVGLTCTISCSEFCAKCKCYVGSINVGQKAFFSSRRFRPIDYDFADQVLEQIFEQELILP